MNWLDIALGFLLGFGCGVAVVFKKWVDAELRANPKIQNLKFKNRKIYRP